MGRQAARLIAAALSALALAAAAGPAAAASPAPACAEGPVTVDGTTYGTACGETIVARPGVALVKGGGGDDTIVPAPIAALSAPCPSGCRLGVGSQTFEGGPGDDIVFGERGNDTLRGGEGDDQLFGGIGDDLLQGGPGADRLAGGFGADSIDGEGGSDYVRGDGTVDTIVDSGAGDDDTLSYATGVTPGFPNNAAYPDFSTFPGLPAVGGERGVYLNLGGNVGDNGVAPFGGGVDTVEGADFETVIGTAFADFIVGTAAAQTIYGGGGGDVILGEGGADVVHGGAEGDRCQAATSDCETTGGAVVQRDGSKIAVGLMAPGETPYSQLYLLGSSAADRVLASYAAGPPASVTFSAEAGSAGFDTSAAAASGCDPPSAGSVVCPLAAPLDSLVMAGLGGADRLSASGFPLSAAVVISGGEDADELTGGETEDVLVDGPGSGADQLSALGGDDALLHNGGADQILGGEGNDLFLSNSICDGDELVGGNGRDNASWARFGEGVEANIGAGQAGRPGAGEAPICGGGESLDALAQIEDLEGSNSEDTLYGGPEPNQLLGHMGGDTYHAGAAADTIFANSGDADPVIDCGGDAGDRALVDHPEFGDAAPIGCESVIEADPNNFETQTELPPEEKPEPRPPVQPPPPPKPDRVPPRTRITAHPAKLVRIAGRRGTLVFRFRSSEPGSRFRCKLDRGRLGPCRSPRSYSVAPGRHAFRVFAVDEAGNADRTPAVFSFTVRRRQLPL